MSLAQVSPLDAKLANVLGGKTADVLRKVFGYESVADLLWHFPRRYHQRGELTTLAELPVGEEVTLVAEVSAIRERRMQKKSGHVLEVIITDGTGKLSLTFFNQAWRMKDLPVGTRGIFAGKVGFYSGQRQLTHPDYELFSTDADGSGSSLEVDAASWAERPIPIYPASARVPSWRIAKMIDLALATLPETMPEEDALDGTGPMDFVEAMRAIHQPATADAAHQAREVFRHVEAMVLMTSLSQRRAAQADLHATPRIPGELLRQFDAALPWALTGDQQSVGDVIQQELARETPMHRLLQGEVGSGKTLVALRAMLIVAESGGQSALLAPTEVLAAQHFRSIVDALGSDFVHRIKPVLLTGSSSAADRRSALLRLAGGDSLIVVGTHALLSENVTFADLGLVVVDEQHRFGVEQRQRLRDKGVVTPHTLVLTATPIPRTVAMTAFGDVEVSTLRELPAGRQGIETHIVPLAEKPTWIERVWQRIGEEVATGRQVFVVAPAIEPGDTEFESDLLPEDSTMASAAMDELAAGPSTELAPKPVPLANVTEIAEALARSPHTKDLRIAKLHGRLPSAEKDAVMTAYANGEIDVLVATTVIEVGVNVPNASTMVVLDADRFGIAQLHQLRGRVGRGEHAGLCLLVTRAPEGSVAMERVAAVQSTLDGFELAERDLELRREGDVLGEQQSGARSQLKLLRVTRDRALIEQVKTEAERIVSEDPHLESHPGLARALKRRQERIDLEFLNKS